MVYHILHIKILAGKTAIGVFNHCDFLIWSTPLIKVVEVEYLM